MLDFGTPKCRASIFITAAFAAPSAGTAVVYTRRLPHPSSVTVFWRARGITRTLKVCFESVITHYMHMKVEYTLSGAGARVRDRAKIFAQPQYVHSCAHTTPKAHL